MTNPDTLVRGTRFVERLHLYFLNGRFGRLGARPPKWPSTEGCRGRGGVDVRRRTDGVAAWGGLARSTRCRMANRTKPQTRLRGGGKLLAVQERRFAGQRYSVAFRWAIRAPAVPVGDTPQRPFEQLLDPSGVTRSLPLHPRRQGLARPPRAENLEPHAGLAQAASAGPGIATQSREAASTHQGLFTALIGPLQFLARCSRYRSHGRRSQRPYPELVPPPRSVERPEDRDEQDGRHHDHDSRRETEPGESVNR